MIRRLAPCFLLMLCVAIAAAQAMPDRVRVSSGVTSGLLQTKVNPNYPPLARQARIQGAVILRVVISKTGDVQDVQLISGHPMLAPAAIEAVKQWKYRPYLLNGDPVEVETQVQVNFTLSDVRMPLGPNGLLQISESVMRPLRTSTVDPAYPPLAVETHVQGPVILNIDINASGEVETVTPFTGNPMLMQSAIVVVRQWKYRPYLLNGEPAKVQTSVSLNFVLSGENDSPASVTDGPLPPSPTEVRLLNGEVAASHPAPQTPLPKRIRVSAGVAQGLVLTKINPEYPHDAKEARIQGVVLLQVNIAEDGTVKQVELISGHPTLAQAAIDAVKQWTYRPYLFNGNPIEVETQVRVDFTLSPE